MEQIQKRQVERTGQHLLIPIPPLPPWPTSKPGPMVTDPPPGQKRMPLRTEQVIEIGYNQEQGKSSVRGEGK